MPNRIRTSGKYIWGLPNILERDRHALFFGNRMIRSAIRIIQSCLERGVCGYLEKPLPSLVWGIMNRRFCKEFAAGLCRYVACDLCQYGTSYKKPTRFMLFGPNIGGITLRRCSGKHGICSRTGIKHEQITSTHDCNFGVRDGQWSATKTQIYQMDLAKI